MPTETRGHGAVKRIAFGSLILAGGLMRPLWASEADQKISVSATGTVSVKPDVAEVRTVLKSGAALASDALKKFRTSRRRAIAGFKGLKMKDLAIEEGGPVITANAPSDQQNGVVFFNGNNPNVETGNVYAIETLLIRLPAIDNMKDDQVIDGVVKIIDAAKDSGLSLKEVCFRTTKLEKCRSDAVRAAMQAARKKAELLAAASDATVGPVLSVMSGDTGVSSFSFTGFSSGPVPAVEADWTAAEQAGSGASGPLSPVKVTASLHVEFALKRSK